MAKKGIKESDKSAVSPVIGVILLVAITVLLSAVVGAMVLGMGGSVEKNVRAGVNVDFEKDDDAIRVLFAENENAKYVNVTMSGWGDEIHVVMWGVGATVITDTNKGTVEVHGGGAVIDKPNDAVKSTGPPCGSPPCGGGGPGGGSGGPPGGRPIGPPGSGTGGPGSGSGGPGGGPG
ncbi:MAG: type IV pilin N-terminal domain-containing protein, partial [Halobacteria archaeon]|nr:type IV pilin N-terminal domain-containing protein [Halobacteria archaeon]